jgi:tetratricopeptide (TPR) repeat protein
MATSFYANRYVLGDVLGAGSTGTVYRAFDHLTNEDVALKQVSLPLGELVGDDFKVETSRRVALSHEFETLAGLHHPHIVKVLDYGFDELRQPFFTMELLEDARDLFTATRHLPEADIVELLVQALQALAYIHRHGILHRDLKPTNILVTPDGHTRILDLGLALTQRHSRSMAGTAAYLSPEVVRNQTLTPASDLFAMGIIIYEVFSGRHPFDYQDNLAQLVFNIAGREPDYDILKQPPALVDVVRGLLAKKPEHRFDSARDALNALCLAAGRSIPVESADIRESYLQAARFVGRERELARLTAAVNAIVGPENGKDHEDITPEQVEELAANFAPAGSAWLVSGESGVGKTRLLNELQIQAMIRGATVLRGQAVAEKGPPYYLLVPALRRLLLITPPTDLEAGVLKPIIPDIERLIQRPVKDLAVLEPGLQFQRLTNTITGLFSRTQEPLVLLVEDLHWADESLPVLARLCTVAADLSLLVVGSVRGEEAPHIPRQLPNARLMPLTRLNKQTIARLSREILGPAGDYPEVLDLIERETEGNVFFMIEVMRFLSETSQGLDEVGRRTLPQRIFTGGMQAVVQRRLDQVPDWGQPMLKFAAVAGRELDQRVLQSVLEVRGIPLIDHTLDQWLHTCANAGVLQVRHDEWSFAHDKLRVAVLEGLSPSERVMLHRLVAEAIEYAYPNAGEYAALLTHHYVGADDADKIWQYAVQAGDQAISSSRYLEAIKHYRRALEQRTMLDTRPQRAGILTKTGIAYHNLSNFADAESFYQEGLNRAMAFSDPDTMALAHRWMARLAIHRSQYEKAMNHLSESLVIYRRHHDASGECDVLSQLGQVYLERGEFEQALGYFDRALSIAEQRDDLLSRGLLLGYLGIAYRDTGRLAKAIEQMEAALDIDRQLSHKTGEALHLEQLGILSGQLGDWGRASEYLEQSMQIRRQTGNIHALASCLATTASVYWARGRLSQALQSAGLGLELAAEIESPPALCVLNLNFGWAALATENLAGARETFKKASAQEQPDCSYQAAVGLGIVELRLDNDLGAVDAFRQAIGQAEHLLAQTPDLFEAWYTLGLARAGLSLLGLIDMQRAEDAYGQGRAIAPHTGVLHTEILKLAELARAERGDLSQLQNLLNILPGEAATSAE